VKYPRLSGKGVSCLTYRELSGEIQLTLKAIFEPESIAVIGASATPGKWGYTILKNLLSNGFPGPVYAVNPKATDILEQTCYPSVLDIPGHVDLAVIVVPISRTVDGDC